MRFILAFLGLFVAASVARAEPRLIAVLPFEDGRAKVEAKLHRQLEQIVEEASEPVLLPTPYRFVVHSRLDQVLAAQMNGEPTCGISCAGKVVRALSLDLYLTGTMSRAGQDYVAFIRVMEPESTTALAAVQLRAATVEGLGDQFRQKAIALFERAIPDSFQAYSPAPTDEEILAASIQACADGNAEACNDAGYAFLYGEGTEKDEARGAKYYEQSCAMKNVDGCTFFAWVLEQGMGDREKDEKKAAATYERGCLDGQGNVYACTLLGNLLTDGRGVRRDRARAAKLYRMSCDKGDGEGCLLLGRAYQKGAGIKQDKEMAQSFFEKGCDLDVDEACDEMED